MRSKQVLIITILCIVLVVIAVTVMTSQPESSPITDNPASEYSPAPPNAPSSVVSNTAVSGSSASISHPMAIESLRQQDYPGGEFIVEEVLPNGTNYQRFIVSYQSEGLKIFGLLTIPTTPKPIGGYPAVVFVHGHIPPKQYSTVNSYPTYQAALARGGFITFKPDLRGHGDSEGDPSSAHYSEKYTADTLNALAYLKQHQDVDSDRIGYWGHSNGGEIGLRTILVDNDIKAASFWAGVVGSYEDMFESYINDIPFLSNDSNPLVQKYGLPSENPEFWETIDPYAYLDDVTIPIELQHGTNDKSVPIELSRSLQTALEAAGKTVVLIEYPGDDHNISQNSRVAWQRTIAFFQENL